MQGGEVTIRRLAAADTALFHALNRVFGDAFDDRETYCAEPPSDDYLSGLLARTHVVALAAQTGEQVVGGLVAYELDKFERQRREIYIYDLAVEESWRRRGIASALIGHLRAVAAARDVYVIFVQADHGDAPAIALYDGLGVREEVLHFDIAVAPSGTPLLSTGSR